MVELKDIDGIISLPAVEGRFKEILSVQKIKDTMTGIEYDGVVDTDFLILINKLNDENEQLKCSDTITDLETEIMKLKEENKQLKQKIKSINEILKEDIGYIESFKKIEEILK